MWVFFLLDLQGAPLSTDPNIIRGMGVPGARALALPRTFAHRCRRLVWKRGRLVLSIYEGGDTGVPTGEDMGAGGVGVA